MSMRDFKDAEAAARRAFDSDRSNNKFGYVLGLTLYSQNIFSAEAISLLARAQEEFPNARIALAIMHASTGHMEMARKTLKGYLAGGHKEHKQRAEQMLAGLPQRP
jgi:hypothetical protein